MRVHCYLVLFAVLLTGCASGDAPESKMSSIALLDTNWTLMQLGERPITTPQDARQIYFVMHSQDQRVTGFSGCNQMMGSYRLNGRNELSFAQMGGTLMACTARMDIEREYVSMFGQVARWQIDLETLSLLDDAGKTLATFESRHTK